MLPIVHDVIPVNMNTLRLEVSRGKDKALITKDRMRVDVIAEFYVRVAANPESVAAAAQTLGLRTMEPEQLKELVEGKFIDRAAHGGCRDDDGRAARKAWQLRAPCARGGGGRPHQERPGAGEREPHTARPDGMEYFNPSNAFDAEGLTRLTEQIEHRKKQRNDVEQDTLIAIRNKNLEAGS